MPATGRKRTGPMGEALFIVAVIAVIVSFVWIRDARAQREVEAEREAEAWRKFIRSMPQDDGYEER